MYFWWDQLKKQRSSQHMVKCHFLPTTFWLDLGAYSNYDTLILTVSSVELDLWIPPSLTFSQFCSHCSLAPLAFSQTARSPAYNDCFLDLYSHFLAHGDCIFSNANGKCFFTFSTLIFPRGSLACTARFWLALHQILIALLASLLAPLLVLFVLCLHCSLFWLHQYSYEDWL